MGHATNLLRVMPVLGHPATAHVPELDANLLRRLLRFMVMVRLMDEKMLLLQRQGRIAFFGPFAGQEAAIIGSGSVARPQDWIFPALREAGILLWRGFPLSRYLAQLFGNSLDVQKGHQQPMHFSSGAQKYLSLSSVIGTQIPQAVGAAMAARLRGDDVVTFGYMGDGATSSTDFHAALTFAATFEAPVLLICQNNHWAISVPFEKQTASAGIAVKAQAYGIPGIAVDGNDVLAVVAACQEAHARAVAGDGPTLLELVTWRRGGHSSSDDPTRYRDESKAAPWLLVDPIQRFTEWMVANGYWDASADEAQREALRQEIDAAIKEAEAAPPPAVETLFEDVYAKLPDHLVYQRAFVSQGDENLAVEGRFPL